MNLHISRFLSHRTLEVIRAAPHVKIPTHEKIDSLHPYDNEKEFKAAAIGAYTYTLVRNGIKYFEISDELVALAIRCKFYYTEYRTPYNPIILGRPGEVAMRGIYLTPKTVLMMDWADEQDPHGLGFIRFDDPTYDLYEEGETRSHQMIGLLLRITTLCYHAGQLLDKLPATGKTRRARAVEQGHRIRMVQTVDWLTQRYAKHETVPTGRTVAPHERRGHSRCVGGRLIDVKPAIIHKDKFIGPTTTIIK